jgi:hypothetical protein
MDGRGDRDGTTVINHRASGPVHRSVRVKLINTSQKPDFKNSLRDQKYIHIRVSEFLKSAFPKLKKIDKRIFMFHRARCFGFRVIVFAGLESLEVQ